MFHVTLLYITIIHCNFILKEQIMREHTHTHTYFCKTLKAEIYASRC